MDKAIYLIRHGESEANAAGIYQGISFETSLTEKGVSQAELTAEALSQIQGITAIYASPLQRTYQTAEIIRKRLQTPLVTDRKIAEINHGSWEGKQVDQFNIDELAILEDWKTRPEITQMPQGEHFNDLVNRIDQFLGDMNQVNGKTIIVTHDAVKRVIICKWKSLPYHQLWSFDIDNCGVTTLGFNPQEIIELNNTLHLNGNRSLLNRQAL